MITGRKVRYEQHHCIACRRRDRASGLRGRSGGRPVVGQPLRLCGLNAGLFAYSEILVDSDCSNIGDFG